MADIELVIKIDEETYKKCKWKNNGVVGLEWWERAIANGTPIPDNATNGDMIKAMFGKEFADKCIDYCNAHMVGGDWWNAPYQKGGK